MNESDLQIKVADYLRLRYKGVLFHSDFGSGVKLTIGQAAKQKRQNGGRRAWPDMFIAAPRMVKISGNSAEVFNLWGSDGDSVRSAHGLFLELKKEGTRLVKKSDGAWATDHIAEQAHILESLRKEGYVAEFAVGFDQAKKIIDHYLGGLDGKVSS